MPVKSRLWSDNTRSTEGFLGNDYLLEPVEIRIPRSRGFRLREFVTDAENESARAQLCAAESLLTRCILIPMNSTGRVWPQHRHARRSCGCAGRAFFGMWRGPIKKGADEICGRLGTKPVRGGLAR